MKPILLVVAGIVMLVLAIYLNNRKAESKQLRPLAEKSKVKGVIIKHPKSFLPDEVAIYHLVF